MSDAADLSLPLRKELERAAIRRRCPGWIGAAVAPAAALAFTVAMQGGIALLASGGAIMLAVLVWIVWDHSALRRRVRHQWAGWLNEAYPQLEDSSGLLAQEPQGVVAKLQRSRIAGRAHSLEEGFAYALVKRHIRINLIPAAAALIAAAAIAVLAAAPHVRADGAAPARQVGPQAFPGSLTLRVTPSAYTGARPFDTEARDLQLPQHSEVRWCAKGKDAEIEISIGQRLAVRAGACAAWTATESVFWRSREQGAARYTIRVIPDQAPTVSITTPKEAVTVLARDAQTAAIAVSAKDDYAIERATLHLTLARGSGENIRFSDREVPLPRSADPRTRNWQKTWLLTELGMEPGDELYFFVRVTDNAPDKPHTVQTPTYTLRLPGPEAESLDASALPSMVKPENLRSQRQIIIDTEQLLSDMQGGKLSAAAVRERSEGIAADQAQLRRRYGQFLGEESTLFADEDHHHEGDGHGHKPMDGSTNLAAQFGHAHDMEDNATIFDPKTKEVLRRAISAMWDAEKALAAITPKAALAPENKALDAIKELQQAERIYLHRTAFVPPAIKEEKRLSGDAIGARSYQRKQDGGSDAVPAEVRELIGALAGEGALPALWPRTAREALAALAEDDKRLAALVLVQEVQDGCASCRAPLRAWLRSTLAAKLRLQAKPAPRNTVGDAFAQGRQP
ncbi:DUF4175 family protein [Massilia sp. SM-13]|uniref:DUF4175 family protein n=1 Tax=Pseudoduganella rhizocola TaxID=3382643 RepID=UPI0038B62927